jgi:hypothetical protein
MAAHSPQLLSGRPTAFLILRGETLRYIWRIPLVVGTFLTLVNQSKHILDGPDVASLVAMGVNYVTPYVVSSLGFLTYRRCQLQNETTPVAQQ